MRLMCLLLLLFCLKTVQAGDPAVFFKRHTINDGLSHSTVLSVLQDSQGFLWLGTGKGLDRFDGYTFKSFHHDLKNPHSISNNWVKTLFEDSKGRLWSGTNGGGINRFDPAKQQFIRYEHNKNQPHSLSGHSVWAIAEDGGGQIWVGTFNGGVSRLNEQTGRFEHFKHNKADPHSLSSDRVLSIYLDRQNQLWLERRMDKNRAPENRKKTSRTRKRSEWNRDLFRTSMTP